MNCEQIRILLPEYWSGAISVNEHKEVARHVEGCEECRKESAYLERIWTNLDLIPAESPSPALRARFYESLDAYRQGMEETSATEKPQSKWSFRWWQHPAFQFGVAAAMVAIGVYIGHSLEFKKDNQQLTELRGEVGHMRQLVALSLMQQQSATDRLRGVNWAVRAEKSDTEVVSALLKTVREDDSVNVRLAAVDALRPFASSSPLIRKALIQGIGKNDSPMVQIALIDLLIDLRDRTAAGPFQILSEDPRQPAEVRKRARSAAAELE